MVKQKASLDASFWINTCAANIITFVPQYFDILAPSIVTQEIRYPLDRLGISSYSGTLFAEWVQTGKITIQDPDLPVEWFQAGENAAIALALQYNYFLLMDDANPYHRAKIAGLKVIGTAEFIVLLFDHNLLSYDSAVDAMRQTHASKKQKREGLFVLESLARRKG